MELTVDTAGRVLGAGARLLSLLGRATQSVTGTPLDDHLANPEAVHGLLAVALRGGDSDASVSAAGEADLDSADDHGRSAEVQLLGADGAVHSANVRVSPLYSAQDGRVERLLLSFEASSASDSDGSGEGQDEAMAIEALEASSCMFVDEEGGPSAGTIEGVRNVSAQAGRLLRGLPCPGIDACSSATQRFAWSALYSAVLQKEIDGLERLLGYSEAELLGRSVDLFRARGEAPPAILDQVGELDAAIRHRHNKLIETVLSSASGAPVFCLVYVLPLHHHAGPRVGSVAVAILDVHSSLPMLQRHVDQHAALQECDLYTFLRLSLLNLLVTDPSATVADPNLRNPIVFASSGFGVMCGCSPHEAERASQRAAQQHMSRALDAQQESLTLVSNFRKDGSRFGNLLFMTPIRARRQLNAAGGGVLFWIGALQALQLQELYGGFSAAAQTTAVAVHAADGTPHEPASGVCRLCEQRVILASLGQHTHFCNIVMQCKTLASSCDETLARIVVRLNAVANTAHIFGCGATQDCMLLEALRGYTLVLTSLTAGSHALPLLSALPPKIDELVAASRVSPSTAAVWADIKAAGARKLAALQHGTQWASELQCTIVPQPGADPLASGQPPTLADFEMVREIQRGSHAAVWLVRKRQTRDEFAMKVIDKNRGRLHRLVTERKVLFSCQSPFVVTVFFAFEDADRLHLVMECLASDAKHLLQRRGVLEERQVISLMADTCLGLEHLHTCGIIHRDLKPENMLLTCEGRVKLADFGLSQLLQRGAIASEEELARDPSIVGTPFYMAPEVIRGKARGYEAAADWWSFGAITYELLTGFTPFQGSKVAEIYRAILSLSFACPPSRCAISAEAADMVGRMLNPNPRGRLTGAPTGIRSGGGRSGGGRSTGESAASAASTHLELGSVLSSLNPEDHDAHLDNLTALNDKVSMAQQR
ncbi:hypothetical protein EMIHUDRAFT_453419 [Emiliania huxleyi CCMP1516]|uniref:non-specific serine/threonine protein kinase n=2 Tax=Emiliania huxleyi TaxID=2903 RepID=A0A0D3I5I6_EMIH1|nr:hypothetical protein EMIHUDRAFT_453419 [Emiliania huxleyi CCMP1516]EOD06521.1 hypothetical protein EMIHUDRAFT_453419 [Emiliania huxleyi CCMP1516]|eukprot:XP_005758950.1 hypothetical protein EMIHUDRAFT_453419 [Emiliania huxleyi CCMP1516]